MCSQVTCPKCEKPDWRGCGAHVEQVLGHVPKDQRCKCRDEQQLGSGPQPSLGGFFSKLFG